MDGRSLVRGEGHVDIFKKSFGGDAADAVGSFDEVVAGAAGMFAAERVREEQGFGELTSAHQEAGAINVPRAFSSHHFSITAFAFGSCVGSRSLLSVFCAEWCDSTRRTGAGQLHINCATGGIQGRNCAEDHRVKFEVQSKGNRVRRAGFGRGGENGGVAGAEFGAEFAQGVHRIGTAGRLQILDCRLQKWGGKAEGRSQNAECRSGAGVGLRVWGEGEIWAQGAGSP